MTSLGVIVSTQARGCLLCHRTIHPPAFYLFADNTCILMRAYTQAPGRLLRFTHVATQ